MIVFEVQTKQLKNYKSKLSKYFLRSKDKSVKLINEAVYLKLNAFFIFFFNIVGVGEISSVLISNSTFLDDNSDFMCHYYFYLKLEF